MDILKEHPDPARMPAKAVGWLTHNHVQSVQSGPGEHRVGHGLTYSLRRPVGPQSGSPPALVLTWPGVCLDASPPP